VKRASVLALVGVTACGGARPPASSVASHVEVFTRAPIAGCYDPMPSISMGEPSERESDGAGVVYPTQDFTRLAEGVRARVEDCRAERAGVAGAITFRLVIMPNGDLDRVEATSSLPPALVACATRAVKTLQTDPPSCGGARTSLVVLFRAPE
jgi:hypothetical protein